MAEVTDLARARLARQLRAAYALGFRLGATQTATSGSNSTGVREGAGQIISIRSNVTTSASTEIHQRD